MSDGAGLRKRKRLAAMRRVQSVALELFDRYGYQQVSIERIAEAAELSPSSVYRYFGTKEQIVLWDEYDAAAIAQFARELNRRPLMAALRHVMLESLAEMLRVDEQLVRRRIRYLVQEPAIAAATAVQALEYGEMIIARSAEERGGDRDDAELYLLAYSFVGAVLGALRYWYDTDFREPLPEILDRLLASLERGFGPGLSGPAHGLSR